MATRLIARTVEIREGTPLVLVARVETVGGTPVTSTTFSSVTIEVFDEDSATPTEPVWQSPVIDPTTVYTDELVYDDAANLLGDSGGRNFLYTLSTDSYSLLGSHKYVVQVHSGQSGADLVDVYQVNVLEVRGT